MDTNTHAYYTDRATRSVRAAAPFAAEGKYRQAYHLMPPAYWMNDPNGFIHYKGRYHLYYQHNPYSVAWANMHWGHASSADLVHWEHHPVALAPSEPYDMCDSGGCFSGTSYADGDRLVVMYTASTYENGVRKQSQCLAFSDDGGMTFQKHPGNPVIPEPPEGFSPEFRDPKLWKHDGIWYCLLACNIDGDGCALLYTSGDLLQWEYKGILARGNGTMGYMWECPDFFELDGRYVLLISPMGMGDCKGLYLIGDMDYQSGTFRWDSMGEIDAGFDYYGAQTTQDAQGRRLIVAWQNGWPWMPWFTDTGQNAGENWCGYASIPRTMHITPQGKIAFRPVAEMEQLRKHRQTECLVLNGRKELTIGDNIHFELDCTVDCSATDAQLIKFVLREGTAERTTLMLDLFTGQIVFDRSASWRKSKGTVSRPLDKAERIQIKIISDTCSLDVYANGYTTTISSSIFSEPGSNGLSIEAVGGRADVNLTMWQLQQG